MGCKGSRVRIPPPRPTNLQLLQTAGPAFGLAFLFWVPDQSRQSVRAPLPVFPLQAAHGLVGQFRGGQCQQAGGFIEAGGCCNPDPAAALPKQAGQLAAREMPHRDAAAANPAPCFSMAAGARAGDSRRSRKNDAPPQKRLCCPHIVARHAHRAMAMIAGTHLQQCHSGTGPAWRRPRGNHHGKRSEAR